VPARLSAYGLVADAQSLSLVDQLLFQQEVPAMKELLLGESMQATLTGRTGGKPAKDIRSKLTRGTHGGKEAPTQACARQKRQGHTVLSLAVTVAYFRSGTLPFTLKEQIGKEPSHPRWYAHKREDSALQHKIAAKDALCNLAAFTHCTLLRYQYQEKKLGQFEECAGAVRHSK